MYYVGCNTINKLTNNVQTSEKNAESLCEVNDRTKKIKEPEVFFQKWGISNLIG